MKSKHAKPIPPPPPPEPEKLLAPEIVADLARAKSHHIDSIFGLKLGEPIPFPRCPANFTSTFKLSEPCQRPNNTGELLDNLASAFSAAFSSCETAGLTDSEMPIYFPFGQLPDGIGAIDADLIGGKVVQIRIYSEVNHGVVNQVSAKFGTHPKPIHYSFQRPNGSEAKADGYEWLAFGLHAKFYLNDHQEVQGPPHGCLLVEPESFIKAKRAKQEREDSKQTTF